MFTATSLTIGQTYIKDSTNSDSRTGKTYRHHTTITITELGPKQVTFDYASSINDGPVYTRSHKMSRTQFAAWVNGEATSHRNIGCQAACEPWVLEGAEAPVDEAAEVLAELDKAEAEMLAAFPNYDELFSPAEWGMAMADYVSGVRTIEAIRASVTPEAPVDEGHQHSPKAIAYAKAMGATLCDSCDGILMGSEQQGTTCNACIRVRVAKNQSAFLQGRMAELQADVNEQTIAVWRAERQVTDAGNAYVVNSEMTELAALGRAYKRLVHERQTLKGYERLLDTATLAVARKGKELQAAQLEHPQFLAPQRSELDVAQGQRGYTVGPIQAINELMATAREASRKFNEGLARA